jgi:hypothetical protein
MRTRDKLVLLWATIAAASVLAVPTAAAQDTPIEIWEKTAATANPASSMP